MIEETLDLILANIELLHKEIDEIHKQVVPIMEDVSKHLAEAKELANKGKLPRKQPKKKYDKDPMGKGKEISEVLDTLDKEEV